MKRFPAVSLLFLSLLLPVFEPIPSAQAASRAADWTEVNDAIQKGLPRTAIDKLGPIVQGAIRDRAWGEAALAISRRIVLEGNIQGNKAEEKITRMETEISRAPREIAPLLETIQANWYWQYFLNNRWRFLQRGQTAQAPGRDFTTWDLPRLFGEIDRRFQKALAAADTLKRIPVSDFDTILQKGSLPDRYRPTLYDFIACEALRFYSSGEQAAAKPEDAFELLADQPVYGIAPVFGGVDQFIEGKIKRRADESPVERAFFLYRDLLSFHRNDPDPAAYADTDLARLVWAYNTASGEGKASLYKAALKAFVDRWADDEWSALALHHWARVRQEENDLVDARALALRGATAFPESPGGRLCRNLVSSIEAKSLGITTERVWNGPGQAAAAAAAPTPDAGADQPGARPAIEVRYRNLTNIHFRAVAYDWNLFLQKNHSRPESLNENERKDLLSRKPTLEWSARLTPTTDYRERAEDLATPSLAPGFYFLIASARPDFAEADNQVVFTDVWVSDLALVVRPRDGAIEGFVLEAGSGEPVAGAEVVAWRLDPQGNRVARPPMATDTNGFFSFKPESYQAFLIRVRHNERELGSWQEYAAYRQEPPRPYDLTLFFTDRALYRPGQFIQYKGICLHADPEKDDYKVLPGRDLTVIFADANNREIARQKNRCNDYGSFIGTFTAPREGLMGAMRIYVAQGPAGQGLVHVEEYKRPKFQVSLDAPQAAARLNDKVTITGRATGYTGAAVDGARVRYRVVRDVRWPYWWGWYSPWRRREVQPAQEIAHGTADTASDGSFQITFTARPDPAVSEKDEASFSFTVFTDVTDGAGETRSAQRSLNVGFTALQATLSAGDWQTDSAPVDLTIRTTSLDGQPQVAEGVVKIHRLRPPARVQRARLASPYYDYARPSGDAATSKADFSNPNTWEPGEVVAEHGFTTSTNGEAKWPVTLGSGAYRAVLESQDRFGRKVRALLPIQVLRPAATHLDIKLPHLLAAPAWSVEPGEDFTALWGTGYETGRAFVEIEHRHRMIQRYWTEPGRTQAQIRQAVTESMRGGFTVHLTRVRENRAYLESRRVDVPWSNKDLDITWEHFTSRLEPNQKETWTAVIQARNSKSVDPKAERAAAEMVATLYDRSLDAFMPLSWQQRFHVFRQDDSYAASSFENVVKQFQWLKGQWNQTFLPVELRYRELPGDLEANYNGYAFPMAVGSTGSLALDGIQMRNRYGLRREAEAPAILTLGEAVNAPAATKAQADGRGHDSFFLADKRASPGVEPAPGAAPDLAQVTARKNLRETAFFFPRLTSDSNGVVRIAFTVPEALTEWRFVGFAHDARLRSGYLEAKTVTARDLMVQPNPPRFLREGDLVEFTVKVSNQSTNRQAGRVGLTFGAAEGGNRGTGVPPVRPTAGSHLATSPTDAALGNNSPEHPLDIPPGESRSYSWRIRVPDGMGFLTYKTVAATAGTSDGEEGFLPVLSRRILVTESLPLPVRGTTTRKFEFARLLKSGKSDTLRHQSVTVQMVSHPAWYAVMALPYLMEFPHECSEQTFNRFYANALARFIARSDPKIERVFEQWRGTPALDSPLEKNQDLKSVVLEETPWLQDALSESQARKKVGLLFDDNRLHTETDAALRKLAELQLPDGSWPWFPGGHGSDYITLYIATGFGRLRHLGVDIPVDQAIRALDRLDAWMDERFREIQKGSRPEDYVPGPTDALYLYGRSFFLKDRPVGAPHQKAVEFFLNQARQHWLKVPDRQSQGQLALALQRFNAAARSADPTPGAIMKSIRERAVTDEELGMFWRETELSWWWYRAPIETQALMIEAFDEVAGDPKAVEECKVWLLKQKQTQAWKTTKATADAVYGLLLRGRNLLAGDSLVEIRVGGIDLTPRPGRTPSPAREYRGASGSVPAPAVEPGTGFYERRFTGRDIKPALGEITVRKLDEGVAWGSIQWQYLEDMGKVSAYEGTPLKLRKALFTRVNTNKGPVLEPVKGPLHTGDELVVRIELRVDRDMEFVHLKDQRGSGTEPLNVLSQYKNQDGLAYYESTRDTASHFFIDYLPKGVYDFEYSSRVQLRGRYQTGVAEIQCMYAPEFNSHSESLDLVVQ